MQLCAGVLGTLADDALTTELGDAVEHVADIYDIQAVMRLWLRWSDTGVPACTPVDIQELVCDITGCYVEQAAETTSILWCTWVHALSVALGCLSKGSDPHSATVTMRSGEPAGTIVIGLGRALQTWNITVAGAAMKLFGGHLEMHARGMEAHLTVPARISTQRLVRAYMCFRGVRVAFLGEHTCGVSIRLRQLVLRNGCSVRASTGGEEAASADGRSATGGTRAVRHPYTVVLEGADTPVPANPNLVDVLRVCTVCQPGHHCDGRGDDDSLIHVDFDEHALVERLAQHNQLWTGDHMSTYPRVMNGVVYGVRVKVFVLDHDMARGRGFFQLISHVAQTTSPPDECREGEVIFLCGPMIPGDTVPPLTPARTIVYIKEADEAGPRGVSMCITRPVDRSKLTALFRVLTKV